MIQSAGGIEFELIRRKVKYMRIQVSPPDGAVVVITPVNLDRTAVDKFIIKRSSWIKKYQQKFQNTKYQQPAGFVNGEKHLLWGKQYCLHVLDYRGTPYVELDNDAIKLWANNKASVESRSKAIDAFYRQQLNDEIIKLMDKWQPVIQVQASSFYIRKMKTKWGSCNVVSKRIAFNLELIKKPIECLEYVVVHELVHLLERSHNAVFKLYMDSFLPDWRIRKKTLNDF